MLYMLFADGFEETEAIAPLDIIRRAGLDILSVGVTGKVVTGSHKIAIDTDIDITEVSRDDISGIILPGGMPGTTNLKEDDRVIDLLKHCYQNKKLIASICAAPSIPGALGMLDGREAICFPGFEGELSGARLSDKKVALDGNFITAAGAGVTLEFGREIVNYFIKDKGDEILTQMQYVKG